MAAALAPVRSLQHFFQSVSNPNTHLEVLQPTILLHNNQYWWNKASLGERMLDRTCYTTLWGIIWNGWQLGKDYLVVGTPGIGKSFFIYFVIWQLLLQNAMSRIVVQKVDGKSYKRYFWDGTNQTLQLGTKGGNEFEQIVSDPTVYYLVDGCEPLADDDRLAHTLLVSSPKKDVYKAYLKEGANKIFMPIWKFDELKDAWQYCFHQGVRGGVVNVSLAKLKQNFAIVGGSCRLALSDQYRNGNEYNAEREVKEAIGESKLTETLKAEGQTGKEEGVSDTLMHWIVQDENMCDTAVYDFASPYIVHLLQQEHDDYIQKHFEDIIQNAKGSRGGVYYGTLAGRFFEDYAIRKICEGGDFTVRKVGGGGAKSIHFPAITYPADINDIIEEKVDMETLAINKVGVPLDPNFPAIDALATGGWATEKVNRRNAVITNDLFFQMKNVNSVKSGAKKVKLTPLNRLVGHMAHHPVRLYQVIPDFNFDKNPGRLTYRNPNGMVGVIPPNVEEWMLRIPTSYSQGLKRLRLQ